MGIDLKDLKESNEFLNLLLDTLNSAVLIVDKDMKIYRFNESFLSLCDDQWDDKGISGNTFGRAMGCIHTIDENTACGETSHCRTCLIRSSLVETLVKKVPVDQMKLEKIFYIQGRPQKKIFELTTRHISYRGQRMVLAILYDITEIESQKIELQRKQSQLDRDLEAAAGIQQSLLPNSSSEVEPIHIAWKFEPCSRIGGDIFNICYPDKDHMGFYIFDVCGHGVPAAMISVAASQFLRGRRGFLVKDSGITSPQHVLNSLNRHFPFERFESYFSMIYMIIDHFRGVLRYSCAGHPPPILLHQDRSIETLNQRGPVIGLDRATLYVQEEKTLRPGDKIVLYTDGILEQRNPSGDFFGKNRFYQALREYSSTPIQELVENVFIAMKRFGETAAPEDDISILGIAFVG